MKRNIKLLYFIFLVLGICLFYTGIRYFNSNNVKFSRYFNEITSIGRTDVRAIDVTLSQNDIIFKSYFNDEKSYLMLALLKEIKLLKQESVSGDDSNYSYSIWNAIETSNSLYAILLDVDGINYNLRIREINIDRNEVKKISSIRYFKANDKSTAILKELLNN